MSILTRTEFAELNHITTGYVNTYIKRNKIVVIQDGPDESKIDTENPANVYFMKNLKRNKKKVKIKQSAGIPQKKTTRKSVRKAPAETKEEKKQRKRDKKLSAEYAKWERKKEKATAIKAEKEAELKTLQVEKMMGQLIPVDLVHQILKINIQNVFISFESELQNLASIYCDILAGGDRGKLSEIITIMRENLQRI